MVPNEPSTRFGGNRSQLTQSMSALLFDAWRAQPVASGSMSVAMTWLAPKADRQFANIPVSPVPMSSAFPWSFILMSCSAMSRPLFGM